MATKTVYQTDAAGMYRGPTDADESPLEPGVWHLPSGTIETPPPEAWPEDQWPRWNGVRWELVVKPAMPNPADPVAKLAAFLSENPDVAALLEPQEPSEA